MEFRLEVWQADPVWGWQVSSGNFASSGHNTTRSMAWLAAFEAMERIKRWQRMATYLTSIKAPER